MGAEPPVWHLGATTQIVAGSIFGLAFVLAVIYMVRVAVRTRTKYPLVMIVGGGACIIVEPFVDVLGHCQFPTEDLPVWIDAFGREIPLYMAPVYTVYFGAAMLFIMQRIARGMTTTEWWRMCVTTVVIFWLFEPIPIHFDMWEYYGGGQPLEVAGMPLWWAPVNFSADLASATLFAVLLKHRYLTDRFAAAFLVLPAATFMAFHTFAAVPVYAALNSTDNQMLTTVGALTSIGLAVGVMAVCGRIVTDGHGTPHTATPDQERTLAHASQSGSLSG